MVVGFSSKNMMTWESRSIQGATRQEGFGLGTSPWVPFRNAFLCQAGNLSISERSVSLYLLPPGQQSLKTNLNRISYGVYWKMHIFSLHSYVCIHGVGCHLELALLSQLTCFCCKWSTDHSLRNTPLIEIWRIQHTGDHIHVNLTFLFVLSCFSCVRLFVTQWIEAHQASLSTGFSRQKHWSELPCSPSGDLPDPGMEPRSPEAP